MNWKPTLTWEDAQNKAKVLRSIREFFFELNVIEVETPLLGQSTVTDVHLEAFKTEFNYFQSSSCKYTDPLYLQTSPEFCMKRLLASGYQSIYQLSKAFRHESKGRYHNPEFTILEWYRIGFSQQELINEVSKLLILILKCDEPEKVTYQNLFIDNINVDPLNTSVAALKSKIHEFNMMSDWLDEEEDIDILLQFLLSEVIEPKIGQDSPIFVYDFPASQASLAKIKLSDSRVAERFECYYKGIELVNGFNELTEPEAQLERFNNDNNKRADLGLNMKAIDTHFIDALYSGLPACSGVALGVDRLLMLAMNKREIDEVVTFTIDRA